MTIHLLMGNEAIGLGAIHAGVNFVSGYPGTPSTEVLETVAKHNEGGRIHVEWSTNEKAALEAAIGASWSGARALVTMKQVGLNVASDPLMTLSYLGVKGGLVLVVADDPGPISSQTEQDTRTFGQFSRVPVLDPSSSGECYGMIQDAFEMSEKYATPVILRPTTRVCHACGTVKLRGGVADCAPAEVFQHADVSEDDPYWQQFVHEPSGFEKDTQRFVVFPRTSFLNHGKAEKRAALIAHDYSAGYHPNRIEMGGQHHHKGAEAFATRQGARYPLGIACGGISYHYVKEVLEDQGLDLPVMKVSTPYPFPDAMAAKFLNAVEEVVVVEELDPYIERALIQLAGTLKLRRSIHGKLDGTFEHAGEQSVETVAEVVTSAASVANGTAVHSKLLGMDLDLALDDDATSAGRKGEGESGSASGRSLAERPAPPELPARPPVLCAGCPHRASFYAVKRAMVGKKCVFCGDIGCYTLGNAAPLDMVDTCVCMGADITVAQGIQTIDADTTAFSFIGDSTFFASGITGIVNAVYNQHDIVVCVLDNSTTAMTGHQPHPGTGRTMMGIDGAAMSIPAVLDAIGVNNVTVDPFDLKAAKQAVADAAAKPGVKAVIFKSPCIYTSSSHGPVHRVNQQYCAHCHACIDQIGCPAIQLVDGTVTVDESLCYGCGLCAQVCAFKALRPVDDDASRAGAAGAATASEDAAGGEGHERRDGGRPREAGTIEGSLEPSVLPGSGATLNCVICGVGGQGNVLASRLIADVLLQRNEHVKTAETIGMAQRGGSVASHVRGGRPQSPLVPKRKANVLIAFEPAEAVRCIDFAAPGCTVIVNTRAVQPPTAALTRSSYDGTKAVAYLRSLEDVAVVEIDGDDFCTQAGSAKVLNIVLLAAAVKCGALGISRDELETAVAARVKPRYLDMNLKAIDAVFNAREKVQS